MKFIVQNLSKCTPRLGIINEINRLPNFQLDTPVPFFYTKAGSIPHITREVLKLISDEPQCLQISAANSLTLSESLASVKMTLAEFIGLPEYFTYITVQDMGNNTPVGHHLQNSIPIWTRQGKQYLTSDSYMDAIEAFKPDMYCLLSDSDTNKSSSKKREHKSVDNTLTFLEKCLDRHAKSTVLQNSSIIAAVEGGHCTFSRERCLKALLKEDDKFTGYLISGLHNNGPDMEFLSFDELKPLVEQTINFLPENKLRIVEGCYNPINIIKFIQLGVDIFDSSYLNSVTERSSALTLDFNYEEPTDKNEFEINMRDEKLAADFTPLVKTCKCLTCSKYSRAYIHHLINVQELLGPVLLSIHNIHHYLEFFKAIRECIRTENLAKLENYIQTQFDRHEKYQPKKVTTPQKDVTV